MKFKKGCNRKCPCRKWVNCNYYTDQTTRLRRLQNKKRKKSIEKYYTHIFKLEYYAGDYPANG